MNLSEYELFQPVPVLMKGKPGTGKTIAAASYCYHDLSKPFKILSVDGKVGAIKSYYTHKCPDPVVIDHIDFSIVTNVYDDLVKPMLDYQDRFDYSGLLIDTLTTTSFQALKYAMENRPITPTTLMSGKIRLTEIEDYNVEYKVLVNLISMMKYISEVHRVPTILAAHILEVEHRTLKGATRITKRLLTGAKTVAAAIPGDFDEIYQFTTESDMGGNAADFVVYTVENDGDIARTALPIPEKISWRNQNFYQLLRGYK